MEVLLFILAILFSVFSALMERRKRRKRLEEAQQQQHVEVHPAKPVVAEQEKEEEPTFGWPFDGDPFAEPVPAEAEVDPVAAEREALEAEREALAVERRTVAAEKQAMERRMETSPQDSGEERRPRRPRRLRNHWFLNPQTARDAIIYMEILSKPKSEREEW